MFEEIKSALVLLLASSSAPYFLCRLEWQRVRQLLWLTLESVTVHAHAVVQQRMQCKVATTQVSRLPKQLQVSLVLGTAREKWLPSVFTGCLWWGCCCCSLDTGCCRWLFFHVTIPVPNWAWSFIPFVLQTTFNKHSPLSLSLSHLGLVYWSLFALCS